MKICMFSNLFPPVVSGSSTQTASLARELVKRGHEVCVITAHVDDNSPKQEIIDDVHIYRLPAWRLPKMGIALNFPWLSFTFLPANQKRINDIIEKHQPDVLHVHNHMFDLAFSAVRMKYKFKLPLVLTLHTIIKHSNRVYNWVLFPIDKIMLRNLVIKHCNQVIHPDVNIEDYAKTAFSVGKNGTIIPYGINLPSNDIEDMSVQIIKKYNLEGKRILLSLGHLHDLRNRKDLVEALPSLLEEFPNLVLVVVGSISTDTPMKRAQELGVADSLILTGIVPHEEISAYLHIADLEAHWLNQDEPEKTSLGIASLEAMSSGTTILSAANPDTYGYGVLKHNQNIVLVEPNKPKELAQTIVGLLRDDTRRKHIGEQARKTIIEYFSWESICKKTIDVYTKCLNWG